MTQTLTVHDKALREIVELAETQGWRIELRNSGFAWIPPNGGPIVHSAANLAPGRGKANLLAELRRSGFQDRTPANGRHADRPVPAPEPPPVATFVRDLSELIEQEIERRTQNLVDQVTALRNENADLRQRLADAEDSMETRAKEAALAAVEQVLAARRRT